MALTIEIRDNNGRFPGHHQPIANLAGKQP
jgi:hypothetical protein